MWITHVLTWHKYIVPLLQLLHCLLRHQFIRTEVRNIKKTTKHTEKIYIRLHFLLKHITCKLYKSGT